MAINERENHIKVLEQFLHDYQEWGEDSDLEKTIKYAISSLKTDLKYDLMYEGEEIFTKADMVAMLEEFDLQFDKICFYKNMGEWKTVPEIKAEYKAIIREKINSLKEDSDET